MQYYVIPDRIISGRYSTKTPRQLDPYHKYFHDRDMIDVIFLQRVQLKMFSFGNVTQDHWKYKQEQSEIA